MKKLHLIGPTAGRDGLVLSVRQGSATESYTLELDQALVDLVESLGTEHGLATARPPEPAGPASGSGRAASGLTPREIQARLRGGRTVTEVAEEAGVDPSWIDRFAGPVRAEQTHAVQRAVRLPLATPRRGLSTQALADAVAINLAERGIPMSEAGEGWSAYHLLGSQWRLRYTFRQRGRQAQAEWQVDMTEGTVTAVNRLGGDLGYVGPEEPAASAGDADPGEGVGEVAGDGAPVAEGGVVSGAGEDSSGGGEELPGDEEDAVEAGEAGDEGDVVAEDQSAARLEATRQEEQARREELARRQEAARQASAAERAAEREAQRQERERVRAARKEAEAVKRAEARQEREREREEKRRAVAAEKAAAKQQAAAARAAAKRRADEERVTARQAAAEQREDRRRADLAAKAVNKREAAAARAATKRAAREVAAAKRPERAGRYVPAVDGQLSFEDPSAEAAGARALPASAGGPAREGLAAPGAPDVEAVPTDADLDVPPPAWLEASGQPADEEAPADDDTTGWRRWRLRTGSRRPGPDS